MKIILWLNKWMTLILYIIFACSIFLYVYDTGIITYPVTLFFMGITCVICTLLKIKSEYCINTDGDIQILGSRAGEISDGYHTFDELYYHRGVLFAVICNTYAHLAWKSKLHFDGSMYDGMFVVGIATPEGEATYHYNLDMWDKFNVEEFEHAPPFTGYSPDESIERIYSLCELLNKNGEFLELTYNYNEEDRNEGID